MTRVPSFSLKNDLARKRRLVEKGLAAVFRHRGDCPPALWDSMRYSVFAGGKRLRPVLCLASGEALGLPQAETLRLACALELIHTYSLIHDDLPALDDDDLRRGKKTNHVVFGEAMAILAGDGLQTLAFEWLSDPKGYAASRRGNLPLVTWELAHHAGRAGMVGGQADDVLSEGKPPRLSRVVSIHRRKTGALLLSSVRLPGLLAGASPRKLAALTAYGKAAGEAFQIIDDILNETGSRRELGKAVGSDRSRGKMTYPAAVGLGPSRLEAERLTRRAVLALAPLGEEALPLAELARHMLERSS